MKKLLVAMAAAAMVTQLQPAEASQLVTPDIPLSSNYYDYIDKLESMGYIKGITTSTRPYSRYYVAKLLAKVNPEGMPSYLRYYYDEMVEHLSDEIAYIIVHEPLNQAGTADASNKKAQKKSKKRQEAYYADRYSQTVKQKLEKAAPNRFNNNFNVKSVGLELSAQSMDRKDYHYSGVNASYQPLHGNNGGHRYGTGANMVGTLNLAGSLGSDVAISITPRFSYDKDQKGTASLDEAYVRTHTGVWTWTFGKQVQNWGTVGGDEGISLSNNAQANTMIKLGLLEPYDMSHMGWWKWIGKFDFMLFYSRLEGNRVDRLNSWYGRPTNGIEKDHLNFWCMRMELQPFDFFTLGMERLSHLGSFGKNWLFIRDDGIDDWNAGDGGNDQAGIDFRFKFPGVQLYGGIHGEDGTTDPGSFFLCHKSNRYGVYFPQLTKDGKWDLRVEYTKNDFFWYTHYKPDANGWVFHDDIAGDDMGPAAQKYRVIVNNYISNGDIITLGYQNTKWSQDSAISPTYSEIALKYDHRVNNVMHWNIGFGYANIKNANYNKGKSEKAKYISAGVNWNF